jgi:hypothetical protein
VEDGVGAWVDVGFLACAASCESSSAHEPAAKRIIAPKKSAAVFAAMVVGFQRREARAMSMETLRGATLVRRWIAEYPESLIGLFRRVWGVNELARRTDGRK